MRSCAPRKKWRPRRKCGRRKEERAAEEDRRRGQRKSCGREAEVAAEEQRAAGEQRAEESARRGAEQSDRQAAVAPPAPNKSEKQKIVTVRVCAVGDTRWAGTHLMDALEALGLAYGRYQVYHRNHSDGRSIFCVASLVEPGTFDLSTMPNEQFRGVSLFAVLPGPLEPMQSHGRHCSPPRASSPARFPAPCRMPRGFRSPRSAPRLCCRMWPASRHFWPDSVDGAQQSG
jgi:FtsZ-interacting cell division protein ZipA